MRLESGKPACSGDDTVAHITSLSSQFQSPVSPGLGQEGDSDLPSRFAWIGISASLFAISATLLIVGSSSMSGMHEMPMPGGWTMSMIWIRTPAQSWLNATSHFLSMWIQMTVTMMMPSFMPILWRYRLADRTPESPRTASLLAKLSLGYLFVWTLVGLVLFPLGAYLASIEMELPALARAAPGAVAAVIMIAGAFQFTSWKAHHLAHCREVKARGSLLPAHASSAWRQGLSMGLHCSLSCANWTAVVLVMGVMNLRVMAVVTAAISAERLLPSGRCVAQTVGTLILAAGLILLMRFVCTG